MDRLSDNEKMPDVPDSTITRGQARELQDTKCVPCVRTVTDAGRCATHGYSYFPKSEEQCDAARPSRSIAQTANDAVATEADAKELLADLVRAIDDAKGLQTRLRSAKWDYLMGRNHGEHYALERARRFLKNG